MILRALLACALLSTAARASETVPAAPKPAPAASTPRSVPAESRPVRFVQPEPSRPALPGAQAVREPEGQGRPMADPLDAPTMNPLQGPAALAVKRVLITVRAIAASRPKGAEARLEIDGRLSPIDGDLRAFANQFSYTGYQLVSEQTFELSFQAAGTMDLPGGRSLSVEPLKVVQDGRVQLHLRVIGPQPENTQRLDTDYITPKGGTLLVGGYYVSPGKPESGTLLIAVTQGSR